MHDQRDLAGQLVRFPLRPGDHQLVGARARGLPEPVVQPDARALEQELQPRVGLDLRYALNNPVILAEYQDENAKIEPRKRSDKFLLAPFHYTVMARRYTIRATAIRTVTEEDKTCRARGVLLSQDGRGYAPNPRSAGHDDDGEDEDDGKDEEEDNGIVQPPPEEPPTGFNQTLYELIHIDVKDGKPIVDWQNTVGPPPPRPTPAARTSAGGQPVPKPAYGGSGSRTGPNVRRGEQSASGWAAVLIEYPEDAAELEIKIFDADPETIDLKLLGVLQARDAGASTSKVEPEKLSAQAASVGDSIADASPLMAHLALAWLGRALASGTATGDEGIEAAATIEESLLTAMGHDNRKIRQAALKGLVESNRPLTEASRGLIRAKLEPRALSAILKEIAGMLSAAAEHKDDNGAAGYGHRPPVAETSKDTQDAIQGLPVSPAASNLFAILKECLNGEHAEIREKALEIALGDGSRQSVAMLADMRPDAKKALTARMNDLPSSEMKATILRLFLIQGDVATAARALDTCGELAIKITGANDPAIRALDNQRYEKVLPALLGVLARGDLDAIARSNDLTKKLDTLLAKHQDNTAIQSAILGLALAQFKPPYEAPVRRGRTMRAQAGSPGFESLLARLAMSPRIGQRDAQAAAVGLVTTGRVIALQEQLEQCADVDRYENIVRALARSRLLRRREALPLLLASCLSHDDDRTLALALDALADIDRTADPDKRWLVNLAIKQGLADEKRIVELTLHRETEIAGAAMGLLQRLAGLSDEEVQQLQQVAGEDGRSTRLGLMANKKGDSVVRYGCVAFVDLETDVADADSGYGAGTRRTVRINVPLPSLEVVIEQEGENAFRVSAEGGELGAGQQTGKPGAGGSATVTINAAPLLNAALRSDAAKDEGLAGKVDLSPVSESGKNNVSCPLKSQLFGSWAGESSVRSSGSGGERLPTRITGAKIVLEPLAR